MSESPESILARFAAAYAEHGPGPERRLLVTFNDGGTEDGYATRDNSMDIYNDNDVFTGWIYFRTSTITRIDYANARYRGEQPLWEREG